MSDHAKLPPSAAERWMNCPGSVLLSEPMPNRSSNYADEGTEAHALAEFALTGKVMPAEASAEMVVNVGIYVNHVLGLVADTKGQLFVEKQVKVSDHIWGTADTIVWDPAFAVLYVRDLKYGAGMAVEVNDNLQLKMYALATLLTLNLPAKVIDIGIVQPRLEHADGHIRTREYDTVDLIEFWGQVQAAEAEVLSSYYDDAQGMTHEVWESQYLNPTEKGCKWCPAAPICPRLHRMAQDTAAEVFAPGMPYDAEALANTLTKLPILEAWIKNVRAFAYAEAEAGIQIPYHKIVEKRAARKWKDEFEASSWISANVGDDGFELKIKTPAQIEKLLKKEDRAQLEDLTIKESSGYTLVHESDKREAVRLDAKSVFETVGETESH